MSISPRLLRIEYQACRSDPFRAPDWRCRLARRVVARNSIGSLRTLHDSALKELAQFLRLHRSLQRRYRSKHRSIEERRELMRAVLMQHFPDMYTAYRIYSLPEEDPSRVEIEARILANQSDEEISPVTGFTPRAISSYEQCFFAVRDSLIVKRYIARMILGPLLHPDTPRTWAFTVKYFAYYGGPMLLEVFLDGLPDLGSQKTLDGALDAVHEVQVKIGSILAAMRIPESINRFNLAEILKAYEDLLDRKTRRQALLADAERGSPQSDYESMVLSILQSIPWATGKPAESHLNRLGILAVNERAREPRLDELLAAAADPHTEPGPDVRLPPPKTHSQRSATND